MKTPDKKKQRKPRTATHRRVNTLLAKFGNECEWWDGGYPECMLPWDRQCNGNPFVCKKLYMKCLASSKKIDKSVILEFEQRDKNSQKPKY